MGTDTQPYLNGKRTYNGGSPHPNSGATKKPQGYIQRELNKQSESRSGKAESFLRAKDAYQQNQQPPSTTQQPMIPEAGIPIGNTGIFKDPTGRLYYGGSPQAQAAAQSAAQPYPQDQPPAGPPV